LRLSLNLGERLSTDRRLLALVTGLCLGGLAAGLALITVVAGPIISFGLIIGVGVGLYVLSDLMVGLYSTLAVVALLPFASLPVRFAITPTFLDLGLGGFLLVYIFQWMTGRRRKFRFVGAQVLIVIFMAYVIFSFVAGLGNGPLTQTVLRRFLELIVSIGFSIVLVDVVRDVKTLRRIALILVLLATVQALVGIALMRVPDTTANRLLNGLSRFGYPGGDVVRYVEDNPDLGERAIGTWVDPNAYGGFLLMVGALAGVQVLSSKPLTGRRWLAIGLFGIIALTILFTQSRGAWLALAGAVFFVAVVRYRWVLVVGVIAAALLLTLPFMQNYVARLTAGFGGTDLATQMRLGEYKDAFTLIGRYPLFGVGFVAPPDRDIYLGVSSTYLKIAGATGLTGLVLFLITMAEVFRYGFSRWRYIRANPELVDMWLGFTAGLLGALISGVVDHYYFNIEFHGAITMMWLFVGLSLASARIAHEPDERPRMIPFVGRKVEQKQSKESAKIPLEMTY